MKSASRLLNEWLPKALVTSACLALAVVLSCNGGGTTNGNVSTNTNGTTTSAANCDELAEGTVLVSSSEGVTSDCDEVSTFTDSQGNPKKVAIQNQEDGSSITAEFRNGELAGVITSDGTTVIVDHKDSLAGEDDGTTVDRVTGTVDAGNSVSVIVLRDTDDATGDKGRRRPSQNAPEFCEEVLEFADLILTACEETNNNMPGCNGALFEAAQAALKLCLAQIFEEFGDILDLKFEEEPDIPLTIQGYITTRPAAGGTTFICSSVAFGGSPPFDVSWAWVSGETTTVTQLAGGTAVGDTSAQAGEFEFEATVTDGAGSITTDTIKLTLGDDFTGLAIVVSNPSPAVDEEVCFSVGGTTVSAEDFGLAQDPGEPQCFWAFGDGSVDQGETVCHTYGAEDCFIVTLICISPFGDLDFDAHATICAGGALQEDEEFSISIAGTDDILAIGDEFVLEADVLNAIGSVGLGWGIVNEIDAELDGDVFSSSSNPVLQVFEEGVVLVGVSAVDAAGRVAIDIEPFRVCGGSGGLFAAITAPLILQVGVPDSLDALILDCDGDIESLSFLWSVLTKGASLSDNRAPSPQITAQQRGFVEVALKVTDEDGDVAHTSHFIFVLEGCEPGDGVCDDFCEEFGADFDPDCLSCGEDDGKCVFCVFESDPDCEEFGNDLICEDSGFCCAGDEFCDFDCPQEDPECFFCEADGVCVFDCPHPDPDCDSCVPDDGFCDFGCFFPDPDCGDNADICFEEGFCCDDDEFCDFDCPEPDPQCDNCGQDGVCVFACPFFDVDCEEGFCLPFDGFCDDLCDPPDPDCDACAFEDSFCIEFCPIPDPDCVLGNCPADGICDHFCEGFDPDCGIEEDCLDDSDCDDGDLCTDDFCDTTSGMCSNTPVDCPPSAPCDPNTGECVADFSVCVTNADCEATIVITDPCAEVFCDFGTCVINVILFCCDPSDGFCDEGCDPNDLDCNLCGADDCAFCIGGCSPPDPDCQLPVCHAPCDGFCDDSCSVTDPECGFCGSDGTCIEGCSPTDPDCLF